MNRNRYQFPLDLGVVIDEFGHTRNVFQSVHRREDTIDHIWVFRNYVNASSRIPHLVITDRHPALIKAISQVLPQTKHHFCIHHISTNIQTNLRSRLGQAWESFVGDFWSVYRSISPEVFDESWTQLLVKYPASSSYLSEELYPIRSQWAHAWTSTVFTVGTRTTGRIESENRMSKYFANSKTTLLQLFEGLLMRSLEQKEKHSMSDRDVSRFTRRMHIRVVTNFDAIGFPNDCKSSK